MDVNLSLDEIIQRKRPWNNNNDKAKKNTHNHVQMKPHKPESRHPYDARNKIIQKTRAKIIDARDILNQNFRDSGIDARNMLIERKKERMTMPLPLRTQHSSRQQSRSVGQRGGEVGVLHKGRFGQRTITMGNDVGAGVVQTLWIPKEDLDTPRSPPTTHGGYKTAGNSYNSSRLNASAKTFVPRGYIDFDNMQQLEDEELARAMHLGCESHPLPINTRVTRSFDGFDLNMDSVEITSAPSGNMGCDPFSIYEAARNRVERLSMPLNVDNGDQLFKRRQINMVATSNLPDSLRARLFGGEPDRRVSHGIYANENGSGPSKTHVSGPVLSSVSLHQRRSPPSLSMPLQLSVVNNKPGYRLLVSNLHSNVNTADIRELFSDIGPMYDAHVVRPGTAEVIYKSLEHAEMAVDAYHQREFDGQPMHCVLVNPHSSNRSTHSVNSRTVTTNSSGVEVDIDALHSVLFRDR